MKEEYRLKADDEHTGRGWSWLILTVMCLIFFIGLWTSLAWLVGIVRNLFVGN